jgi:hypothetical protein
MSSLQAVTSPASSSRLHEFTADLVVSLRRAAADGVVVLDLADPQGAGLPAWEPGPISTYCSLRGSCASTPCVGTLARPMFGASVCCLTRTVEAVRDTSTTPLWKAPRCGSGVPATIFRSSIRRGIY